MKITLEVVNLSNLAKNKRLNWKLAIVKLILV